MHAGPQVRLFDDIVHVFADTYQARVVKLGVVFFGTFRCHRQLLSSTPSDVLTRVVLRFFPRNVGSYPSKTLRG